MAHSGKTLTASSTVNQLLNLLSAKIGKLVLTELKNEQNCAIDTHCLCFHNCLHAGVRENLDGNPFARGGINIISDFFARV